MRQKIRKPGARLGRWFGDVTVKRIFRNAGVLLGGKSAAGLLSIAYIPLATHGLGAAQFGILVLVNGYTRAMAALFTFQVRLALIRYATFCLHEKSRDELKKLLGFILLVELGFGVLAISLAALLAPFAAEIFLWPGEALPMIVLYSLTSVSMIHSMPAGVLFVFKRFKLLSLQHTVAPLMRLIGASIAYFLDAGLNGYLLAWLAGSLAEASVQWFFCLRELARRNLLDGLFQWPRGINHQHPGLWRFILTTKFDTSLEELSSRATPLAVGWILGPAATGFFHVALKLGMVLTQPMALIGQTLFPELSQLVATRQTHTLGRVVLRTGLIAFTLGLLILLLMSTLGERILVLYGGEGFDAAFGVLILITLAATIQLFGFPMNLALVAYGQPGTVLRIKLIASVLLFPVLLGLLEVYGLNGAGYYVMSFAVTTVTALAFAFRSNAAQQR